MSFSSYVLLLVSYFDIFVLSYYPVLMLLCFYVDSCGVDAVKLYQVVRHSKICIPRLGHFVMNKGALICGLARLLSEPRTDVC